MIGYCEKSSIVDYLRLVIFSKLYLFQLDSSCKFEKKTSANDPDELESRTSVLFGISRDVVYDVTFDHEDQSRFQNMSTAILKMKCGEQGLKIVGKKDSLVKRLLQPNVPSSKKMSRPPLSDQRLGWILAKAGVSEFKNKGNCMKRAIQRGYVPFDGEASLEKVIVTGFCQDCGQKIEGTIGELLNQVCRFSMFLGLPIFSWPSFVS